MRVAIQQMIVSSPESDLCHSLAIEWQQVWSRLVLSQLALGMFN